MPDPVAAACALTGEWHDLARNTYAKKHRQMRESWGDEMGTEIFREVLCELKDEIDAGKVRSTRSALLNSMLNRRINMSGNG
jgi:hypothetical protein